MLSPAPASVWLSVGMLAPAHGTAVGVNIAGPDAAYANGAQGDIAGYKCICMRECMNMGRRGTGCGGRGRSAGKVERSEGADGGPVGGVRGMRWLATGWSAPAGRRLIARERYDAGAKTGRPATAQPVPARKHFAITAAVNAMAGAGALQGARREYTCDRAWGWPSDWTGRPGACEERAVEGRPGCAVIAG